MASENKKLTDKLASVRENYYSLLEKNAEEDRLNTRKRSCCDEWSVGSRLKEFKSTVSRAHVRIDPSDMSLVGLILIVNREVKVPMNVTSNESLLSNIYR